MHLLIIAALGLCGPEAARGQTKKPSATKAKSSSASQAKSKKNDEGKRAPKKTQSATKSSQSFIQFVCSQNKVTVRLAGRVVGMLPLPGPWLVQPGSHEVEFRSGQNVIKTLKVMVRSGMTETASCEDAQPVLTASQRAALTRYRWAPVTISDIGLGIAVAGLVSIGIGAWYGLESKERSDEATKMRIRETYRRDFQRLADMAEESALTANLSYGIGAAGLIAGLAMAFFGEGGLFAVATDQDASGVIIQGEF